MNESLPRGYVPQLVLLAFACACSSAGEDDPSGSNPSGGTSSSAMNNGGTTGSVGPGSGGAGGASSLGQGATAGEMQTGNVPLAMGGAGGAPANSGNGGSPPVSGTGGTGNTVPVVLTEVYIAPAPLGNDANPGTQALPLFTLARAATFARPDVPVLVLPGTFNYNTTQLLSSSGVQGNLIEVQPAPGAGRPVFEFATQPRADASRGVQITGNFWHIRGLEIRNAGDNGIAISGSNNTIENVILHGNGDTGLQITAPEAQATDNSLAANNLILNCDSFENFDPQNNGENADGFAAKLRIGPGNVFRGCRAWNNADDGWDFFASNDVVTIEDSWAFLNGIIAGGGNSAGDGNGFKLGGEPNGVGQGHAPHIVRNGSAFANRTCGYTQNNNDTTPVITNCGVGANGDDYCGEDLASCANDFDVNISGQQAITRARNADGSLPSLR
jgi:pectate disaccharide-lyase